MQGVALWAAPFFDGILKHPSDERVVMRLEWIHQDADHGNGRKCNDDQAYDRYHAQIGKGQRPRKHNTLGHQQHSDRASNKTEGKIVDEVINGFFGIGFYNCIAARSPNEQRNRDRQHERRAKQRGVANDGERSTLCRIHLDKPVKGNLIEQKSKSIMK